MNCADCVHYEVCKRAETNSIHSIVLKECDKFKYKLKIIELPCIPGETVYTIYNGYITTAEVLLISVDRCGILFDLKIKTKKETVIGWEKVIRTACELSDIFLAHEDAEQALKEMEGKS